MLDRIKEYLAPPVFEDEEKGRTARLLYVILLTLLAASSLVMITSLLFDDFDAVLALMFVNVAILGSLWLTRRGYLRLSSFLVLLVLLGMVTFLLYVGDGIHDIAAWVYPIVIIAASLLLDRHAFIVLASLSILSAGWTVYAELNGIISAAPIDPTSYFDYIVVSTILSVTAITVRLLSDSLTQSLARARQNERALAESNRELLHEIAERERAEEALKRRNRELSTLYEATTAISSDLSLDVVLRTVAEQMTQALGSSGCALSLWNREENGVEVLVDYGVEGAGWLDPPGTIYNLDDYPATRRVLETRQPMVIQHDNSTTDEAELALLEEQRVRTLLMLPLIARDHVVGLVELVDEIEARDYAPEEIRLAESLAAQAAVAIENAWLYEQAQQEIAERKRAEAEILRLQHLLQNITDSMPSALIALDTNGQVLLWNPTAEALTGRAMTQMQGQILWETCPELAHYRELFERMVIEGQATYLHKERLLTEAGVIYRDVSFIPLEAHYIGGVLLLINDVTRRVQLEEMMLQSAKLASVGGLAAGIAHELNNPLSAMMQSAQILQMAFDTQRPRTRKRLQTCGVNPEGLGRYLQERGLLDYLDGIRTTGARAAKIVSDLLGFSRKSSSKVAPCDPNTLVEQALDLAATDYDLKKKYDFRNMEVVRELAPDLPQVVCDGQQIQQVVLNLVRNAAQAMAGQIERADREGEYQPRLTLRTTLLQAQDGEIVNRKSKIVNRVVRLEVEDNGPGIPEAVRARLFEPFFTTKEVDEGTGLGLWLCWSIVVERHGGRIWAEPVPEGGTRFVVELPLTLHS